MPQIILTEEQARIVAQATGSVEVRTPEGKSIGAFSPLSPEEIEVIALCKRRMARGGPRYSAAEVRARLLRLEEISRREPLDKALVMELLRRMRAGEEVCSPFSVTPAGAD
jgi:hypothetical protein